jgi:branched-chain amino acid transport system ATP-binding protein
MAELLRIERLVAGYGEAHVLAKVDFTLEEGRSLALLGRNGAGKTTLLNTIIGVTTHHAGSIHLQQRDITRLGAEKRVPLGIGWVPQERNIFRSLTVEENLTASARPGAWNVSRVYQMFPRLQERRRNLGNQLSGGEQQMLAIARALMLNPKILLLDEPLEGLAPVICDELMAAFTRLAASRSMTIVLVEQRIRTALAFAERVFILDRGQIAWTGTSQALEADPATVERLLSVGR